MGIMSCTCIISRNELNYCVCLYVHNVLYVYNCIHKKAIKPSCILVAKFCAVMGTLFDQDGVLDCNGSETT